MTAERTCLTYALAIVIAVTAAGPVVAQQVPDEDYLRFVPLEVPRLIRQTPASANLHLFGDPSAIGYTDSGPVDGIDDNRALVLTDLGVRFAPFLVQNSEMVPLDFRQVTDGGGLPLHVDTWDISSKPRLAHRDTVDWLGAQPSCTDSDPAQDDCRLVSLLQAYHPESPSSAVDRASAMSTDEVPFEVLWLDFPGSGPETWKEAYRDTDRRLRQRYRDAAAAFVHPFLEQVASASTEQRYRLVLQYWLFYPYNDGGNNHEGDWEHIQVLPSPRSRVESEGLSAAEITRILDGDWPAADPLVIRRVEYYFHSKVAVLDYGAPNAYLPRDEWEDEIETLDDERMGARSWFEYIRWLAYEDDAESRINTHPVGYIGADNKGLDQLLSSPGGTNHDSHGTYPRPGLFKDIGPAGASEEVSFAFDHRAYFSANEQQRATITSGYSRGSVVFLGSPDRIRLVPDWERIDDLVLTDRGARVDWAWLILPVRWGYPATESPFAGVVDHAETGNLSILGPAFNSGWNRSGPRGQYELYRPQTLSRLFPTNLQGEFDNDLGFLNATLPTMTFLPPFDLLWRVGAAPLRALLTPLQPTYYPHEKVPHRFLGLKAGVTWQSIPKDYLDLFFNREQGPEFLSRVVSHLATEGADATTTVTGSMVAVSNEASGFIGFEFFVGTHFSSVNTIRHSRPQLVNTLTFSNIAPFEATADLNLWEYAGSLRYSLNDRRVQPFLKGGYGLTWYRLERFSTNGVSLDEPESDWVRRPSLVKLDNLLPNTWHFGAGVELLATQNVGSLPGGLDVSLTAEWLHFTNKLGLDKLGLDIEDLVLLGVVADDLPRERWVGRNTFNLAATLSF